jgi:hypothetical protein
LLSVELAAVVFESAVFGAASSEASCLSASTAACFGAIAALATAGMSATAMVPRKTAAGPETVARIVVLSGMKTLLGERSANGDPIGPRVEITVPSI